MTDHDQEPPPDRRLKMSLTLYGNSLTELHDELGRIALDLLIEKREERDVTSGAGYYYSVVINNPEMTPERYSTEVQAWLARRWEKRES